MKVVKFESGTWALRKFSLGHMQWVYLDLVGGGVSNWRTRSDEFFGDCLKSSEAELVANKLFKLKMLHRKVVEKKSKKELSL